MTTTPIRHTRLALPMLLAAALWAGCSGTPKVNYGDAVSADPISVDFGSSDLQQIAGKMVDSLLASQAAVPPGSQPPVLLVSAVKNKTMQHIDTESVTDSIRTKLIRSGAFRFIDRTTDDAALAEMRVQLESGLVDPATAVRMGKQLGARYLLTSNLSEIRQKAGRKTDVYYKFTMNLKNLESGILEWADEKEIRKVSKKPLFGL